MITVDLATKIIPPTQKIWLIHPGVGRRYYSTFHRDNMVFLSMPGLNLTLDSCKSEDKIRQHIRMAYAIRNYFEVSHEGGVPSKNPATYSSDKEGTSADFGNVTALYCTAKPGDLVIVTGQGYYQPILIGEIASDFNPADKVTVANKEYAEVQYRRVTWLSTRYAKRDLGQQLAERLINRKAVVQLQRDAVIREIYRFAYSAYILGEDSKVDLYGPTYKGEKDFRATNSSTDLVAYLSAAYSAIQKGKTKEFGALSFDDAIEKFANQDLVSHFYQEFHSPGKFVLFAQSAAFAAFIIIAVSTLTSDASAADLKKDEIKITNSVSGNVDENFKNVCQQYKDLLNSMGKEQLCDVKDLAEDAHKRIGLKTIAKVKIKP